ncbi:hypothetical protein Droror1_Dr00012249 [Drosera rotundifolia]
MGWKKSWWNRRTKSTTTSSSSPQRTRKRNTTKERTYLTPVDLLPTDLEGLEISSKPDIDQYTPRSFPDYVKKQCWEKAEKVKGRDPSRWRRDPFGNIVFRKLVGCPGCLCHEYDHIVPYSKGGQSTLENCQVLQASVNRAKGCRTDIPKVDLINKSSYCRVSGRDLDLIELSAYGNVNHAPDSGGCSIQ